MGARGARRLPCLSLALTGLLGGMATACERPTETTPPTTAASEPDSDTTEPDADTTEPPPTPPPACGTTGLKFDDHRWIVSDTPATASIQLSDPDLGNALGQLADFANCDGHGLPIPLAFSLGQWTWQVPTLRATLHQAGFEPAELVFVAGPDADNAWVWRSDCDLDTALERIEAAWDLEARRVVEGIVASPRPSTDPDAPAFPYEVVLLPAERIALVPVGRATALLQRWGQPRPAPAPGSPPSPGQRLDDLAPGAIRLAAANEGLLDPTVQTGEQAMRAWEVDGQQVREQPSE